MTLSFFINFDSKWVQYSLIFFITFGVAMIVSNILRKILHRYIEASAKKLRNSYTSYNFIKNAVSFIIYIIALVVVFYLIPEMKAFGLTLFASAGVFAAVLAMASSQAFSNIISGVFIVIFQPFRVDDRVNIGVLYSGTIEDITLRHTVIKDFENQRVIIPNSVVSNQTIVNMSLVDEKVNNFLEIPVPFDTDLDAAKQIMKEEAEKHPNLIDNRTDEEKESDTPLAVVKTIGFLNSMITLRVSGWTTTAKNGFALKSDLREAIVKRFREKGIYVGLPHQQITLNTPPANTDLA